MGTFIVYDPVSMIVRSAVRNDIPHDTAMCAAAAPPGHAAAWTPDDLRILRPDHDVLRLAAGGRVQIEHVVEPDIERAAREQSDRVTRCRECLRRWARLRAELAAARALERELRGSSFEQAASHAVASIESEIAEVTHELEGET